MRLSAAIAERRIVRYAFFALVAIAHFFTCAKTHRLYNQAGLPAGQCVPIEKWGNEPFPILLLSPDENDTADLVVVLGDELEEFRKAHPLATVQLPIRVHGELKVRWAPGSIGDRDSGAGTPSATVEQLPNGQQRVHIEAPFNEDVVTNRSEYETKGDLIEPICFERVDRHTSIFGLKGIERPCGFASAQTVVLLLLASWFVRRQRKRNLTHQG